MKLFGILHSSVDGSLSVRPPKGTRLSIGLGKGKDIHVHIGPTGKWLLTLGSKVTPFDTREQCEEAYAKAAPTAPERKAPKKLPYFTFTHAGANGQEPDFDAIEVHGSMPTALPVVVYGTRDQIFQPEMNMWSTRELTCKGDGLVGHRLAKTDAEKALPLVERRYEVRPCFADGCKFAQGDNPACKPHAALYFQLAKYPTGIAASYETTGFAGIKAIGGVMEQTIADGEVVEGKAYEMGIRAYVPRKGSGTAYHVTLRPLVAKFDGVEAPEMPQQTEEEQAAQYHAEFTDGESV